MPYCRDCGGKRLNPGWGLAVKSAAQGNGMNNTTALDCLTSSTMDHQAIYLRHQ